MVAAKFNGEWEDTGRYDSAVQYWAWQNSETFRIIDERYKPVNRSYLEVPAKEPVPDLNIWYDYDQQKAIALPPAGVECEACDEYGANEEFWFKVKILDAVIGDGYETACVRIKDDGRYGHLGYYDKFRPLDHATRVKELERNEFVEFVTDILYKHCCATEGVLRSAAEKLFELGFKLPSDTSGDTQAQTERSSSR